MSERPIIFSAESVRAILAGRKTQTRRVVKPQPYAIIDGLPYVDNPVQVVDEDARKNVWRFSDDAGRRLVKPVRCPYEVGDRLWVRETWNHSHSAGELGGREIYYKTDGDGYFGEWISPIYMPRWASRLTLEIVSIWGERLQDITPDDAYREGIQPVITAAEPDCLAPYRELWDSLNAQRGYPWASNPWVWVIEFRKVEP